MAKKKYTLMPENEHVFLQKAEELLRICLEFKFRESTLETAPDMVSSETWQKLSEIENNGIDLDELLNSFKQHIIPSSLNFSSPHFLAHPDCGNGFAPLLGDLATAFLQQNLASDTYSPAASRVELGLLEELRKKVGFSVNETDSGVIRSGGAFVFGGSGANFSCLLAAREQLKSSLAKKGELFEPRRCRVLANRPFTHYSLRRSLYMLGLGNRDLTEEQCADLGLSREALHPVETEHFRMDCKDLEQQIEHILSKGEKVMAIFAVSGDSRMMAFDDLERIAELAQKYGIWVHVDACEGGQCLFSKNRRHLFSGIEKVDSISMDPHKVFMLPYNLSFFFLRDCNLLPLVSGGASEVITQGENSFGAYTPAIGSKNFMSLKLWFLLKHWGWKRLEDEIDRRHELALKAADYINSHQKLTLINPMVQHNSVAFMYRYPEYENREFEKINAINEKILANINNSTSFHLHTFPCQDDESILSTRKTLHPLRMMFGNPLTKWQDVEKCLQQVVQYGEEMHS